MSNAVFNKSDLVSYNHTGPWQVTRIRSKKRGKDQIPRTCYDLKWVGEDKTTGSTSVSCAAATSIEPMPGNGTKPTVDAKPIEAQPVAVAEPTVSLAGVQKVSVPARIFIRPTYATDEGKRRLIAGIAIGDLGTGGEREDDELWLCDVVITPIKKYRGYKNNGKTIEQALLGDGLSPESFLEEIKL